MTLTVNAPAPTKVGRWTMPHVVGPRDAAKVTFIVHEGFSVNNEVSQARTVIFWSNGQCQNVTLTPQGDAIEYAATVDPIFEDLETRYHFFRGNTGSVSAEATPLPLMQGSLTYQVLYWIVAGSGGGTKLNPATVALVDNMQVTPYLGFGTTCPEGQLFEPHVDDIQAWGCLDVHDVTLSSTAGGALRGPGGAWLDPVFPVSHGFYVGVVALPDPGYYFDHYTVNGQTTTSSLQHIQEDTSIQAHFAARPQIFAEVAELTGTTPSMDCVGFVDGISNDSYLPGSNAVVTAVAHPFHRFHHWEGAGVDAEGHTIQGYTNPVMALSMDGDKYLGAVFEYHPIELKQGDREILETEGAAGTINGDANEDGFPDNAGVIDVTPSMPALIAQVPNGDEDVETEWRLEITFDPDAQPPTTAYIPGPTNEEFISRSQATPIEFYERWNGTLMGGNTTLFLRSCDGTIINMPFVILGTNPSNAYISNELTDSAPEDWETQEEANNAYRALCWQESKFRQFRADENDPDGGAINFPLNQGWDDNHQTQGDGGYGLGQITFGVQIQHMWNWRVNGQELMQRLEQNIQQAITRIDNLIRSSPLNYVAKPLDIYKEAWYKYQQGPTHHYWQGLAEVEIEGITVVQLVATTESNNGTVHVGLCTSYFTETPWLAE